MMRLKSIKRDRNHIAEGLAKEASQSENFNNYFLQLMGDLNMSTEDL